MNAKTETKNIIKKLTESGMLIEQVGDDAYNVMSTATGAVLERLISASDLARYVRGMKYIAQRHDRHTESFKYVKPVHI